MEKKGEIDKIAEELQVSLPHSKLPTPLRLITLFTLLGGLSILGSLFADVVRPSSEGFGLYLLRAVVGLLAVVTAYGIERKRRWSFWLYGVIVIIGLLINPLVALLPFAILTYLITKRELFKPSVFDKILSFLIFSVKLLFRKDGKNPPIPKDLRK